MKFKSYSFCCIFSILVFLSCSHSEEKYIIDYYSVLDCYDSLHVVQYKALKRYQTGNSAWMVSEYDYISSSQTWKLIHQRYFKLHKDTLFIGGRLKQSEKPSNLVYVPMYFIMSNKKEYELPVKYIYCEIIEKEQDKHTLNQRDKFGKIPPVVPTFDEEMSRTLVSFSKFQENEKILFLAVTEAQQLATNCYGKQEIVFSYDFRIIEKRGYYAGKSRPLMKLIEKTALVSLFWIKEME